MSKIGCRWATILVDADGGAQLADAARGAAETD